MKFEEFLMLPSDKHPSRITLEKEVEELQERLNEELKLNGLLRYALHRPILSCTRLSPFLLLKVEALGAELGVVEKEIAWLETTIDKLKTRVYRENLKQVNKVSEIMRRPRKRLQIQPLPC